MNQIDKIKKIKVPKESKELIVEDKRGRNWTEFLLSPIPKTSPHTNISQTLSWGGDLDDYIRSQIEMKKPSDPLEMDREELMEKYESLSDIPDRGEKEWDSITFYLDDEDFEKLNEFRKSWDLKWEDYVFLCAASIEESDETLD